MLPAGGSALSIDLLVSNVFDTEYTPFLSRYKVYAVPSLSMGRSLRVQFAVE
jgi:hypothetical protein